MGREWGGGGGGNEEAAVVIQSLGDEASTRRVGVKWKRKEKIQNKHPYSFT